MTEFEENMPGDGVKLEDDLLENRVENPTCDDDSCCLPFWLFITSLCIYSS